jgi:hypothetical protein
VTRDYENVITKIARLRTRYSQSVNLARFKTTIVRVVRDKT